MPGPPAGEPNSLYTVKEIIKSMSKLSVHNRYKGNLFSSFLRILLVIIIIQIFIPSSCCLTDLDYSLRKPGGTTTERDSFHGSTSAELTVKKTGSSSSIYVYLDQPLALEDLDRLSLWVNPQSGIGAIKMNIYLEGDGDETKVTSLEKNWSELQMSYDEWNELDGFDLDYSRDKSGNIYGLDGLKEDLQGKKIVKIFITFSSRDKSASEATPTSVFIDYVKIGDEVISFEPLEEEDVKDGPSSATAGGLMTYTITYGNNNLGPADVIVKEEYDPRTVFVSSYPPPDAGTFDTWTFSNLPAGAHGQIVIKMRTKRPSATAGIDGRVTGQGLSSTHGLLSTEFDSYLVTNNVHIQAGDFNFTDSAYTKIRPIVGSTLEYGEHGSGWYQSEEMLNYSSTSIRVKRKVFALASPVQINLSQKWRGRGSESGSIDVQESWSAALRAENDYRDILWRDRYWQAKKLNLSFTASMGKTLSTLETSAQVLGLADRTAVWPTGRAENHLSGDFSLAGTYRWKFANKSISAAKQELECCPVEQEDGSAQSTAI